eukprot:653973-Amphidinium_carterae.1
MPSSESEFPDSYLTTSTNPEPDNELYKQEVQNTSKYRDNQDQATQQPLGGVGVTRKQAVQTVAFWLIREPRAERSEH